MSGFNLPPGCSVRDIPGNRTEDEKWEVIENGFWDSYLPNQTRPGMTVSADQLKKIKTIIEDNDELELLVMAAIEYGIDIGAQLEKEWVAENAYYEQMARDYESQV